MARILDVLNKADFRCVSTAAPQTLEELQEETDRKPVYRVFENPKPRTESILVEQVPANTDLLFRYFIDGSERVTAIGHLIDPNNRYLPLFVAQIGVATTKLEDQRISLENYQHKNILVLPDSLSEKDRDRAKTVIKDAEDRAERSLNLDLDTYNVKGYGEGDAMAEARERILKLMHQEEIDVISRLAGSGKVTRDALLIIDGSLQFFEDLDKHKEAFRNVIGVAKQFDTNKVIGTGKNRKYAGALVAALPRWHRTPAQEIKHRNRSIGTWYMRLRGPDHMKSPEDGVIKIEVFPEDSANAQSLEATLCDNISRHILALRHPTTPNTDGRWASHLYPIHVTERFVKTQFQTPEKIVAHF